MCVCLQCCRCVSACLSMCQCWVEVSHYAVAARSSVSHPAPQEWIWLLANGPHPPWFTTGDNLTQLCSACLWVTPVYPVQLGASRECRVSHRLHALFLSDIVFFIIITDFVSMLAWVLVAQGFDRVTVFVCMLGLHDACMRLLFILNISHQNRLQQLQHSSLYRNSHPLFQDV